MRAAVDQCCTTAGKKGLSELIWCCLSACWGYPGWAVRKARVLLWLFIVMGWILSGEIYRASPQHIQLWGGCGPWHQCGKEFSVWQAVSTRSDGLLPLMPLVLMRETVWNELLSLFPSLLSTVSAGDCPPSKNKTIGHLYKHLIMTCVYVLNLNTLQNIVRARKCVLRHHLEIWKPVNLGLKESSCFLSFSNSNRESLPHAVSGTLTWLISDDRNKQPLWYFSWRTCCLVL